MMGRGSRSWVPLPRVLRARPPGRAATRLREGLLPMETGLGGGGGCPGGEARLSPQALGAPIIADSGLCGTQPSSLSDFS